MTSNPNNPLLTPEDHAALAELPKRLHAASRAEGRTTRALHAETQRALTKAQEAHLAPWMVAFAEWYALQPKYPPAIRDQVEAASAFAATRISTTALNTVKRRADWHVLVDKFYQGGIVAARTKMEADAVWYINMHKKGLEKANEADDYRAFPNFTLPWIERVSPRRNDLAQQNLQVNITLSPKQLALEETDTVEVTAEPIAPTDPV